MAIQTFLTRPFVSYSPRVEGAYKQDAKQPSYIKRALAEKTRGKSLETIAFEAAFKGFTTLLKLCLMGGVSPDAINKEGLSLLQIACYKGHVKVVRYLIEEFGADPHKRGTEEQGNAMEYAIINKQYEIAKFLLEADPSLLENRNQSGDTPLHMAADMGDIKMYRLLVRKGADENALDSLGRTACQTGYTFGHPEFSLALDAYSCSLLALEILSHTLSVSDAFFEYDEEDISSEVFYVYDNLMMVPFAHALFQALEKEDFPYPILGQDNARYLKSIFSTDFVDRTPSQEKARAIQEGKLQFLGAGWAGHEAPICICGKYLAIGNTGEGSGNGIQHLEVFKIDPSKVTEEILLEINRHLEEDSEGGKKFLYKTLPSKLSPFGFPVLDNTCWELKCMQPVAQEYGTCRYDGKRALMGFAWVMLTNPEFNAIEEVLPALREANHFLNDTACESWNLLSPALENSSIRIPQRLRSKMEEKFVLAEGRQIEYFSGLNTFHAKPIQYPLQPLSPEGGAFLPPPQPIHPNNRGIL